MLCLIAVSAGEQTCDHIKDIMMKGLADPCGKLRIIFATVALEVGVNLADVNKLCTP